MRASVPLVYAALYLVQYIFSALYDNPQRVWDVMNVVSGPGILIAVSHDRTANVIG